MKTFLKRIVAIMLIVEMLLQPGTITAKEKVVLSKQKVTVEIGKTTKIAVENTKKYSLKLSQKNIVSVKRSGRRIVIKGKKAGKVKLYVCSGKMRKSTIQICVKNKSISSHNVVKANSRVDLKGESTSHNYEGNYSSVPEARLFSLANGDLLRVENAKKYFIVECFDASYKSKWVKKVKRSLPFWGTVAYDGTDFFVVTGQENPKYKDSVTCFAITRYNSEWKRTGQINVTGCYTSIPFDAGSCSVAFYKDMLYVKTCREMYRSSDGKNHQSNITIVANKKTMTLLDYPRRLTDYVIEDNAYGYVSHSFNQIARIDEGKLVAVDHGDAYPREIVLSDITNKPKREIRREGTSWLVYETTKEKQYPFVEIAGRGGDNTTGATLGDFQVSDTDYLMCGTTVDQNKAKKNNSLLRKEKQNVFLSVMNKKTKKVTFRWVTSYKNSEKLGNPYLTKLSSNRFMLMWTYGSTMYYQEVNGQGAYVGKRYSLRNTKLSSCEPIVADGKIQWFYTNKKKVYFYFIELNNPPKEEDKDKIIEENVDETTITSIGNIDVGISLTWNMSKNAEGYQIYRKTDGGEWSRIERITSNQITSFVDTAVSNGVVYHYAIFAYRNNVEGKYYTKGTPYKRISSPTISHVEYHVKRKRICIYYSAEGRKVELYRKTEGGEWQKEPSSYYSVWGCLVDRGEISPGIHYEYKLVLTDRDFENPDGSVNEYFDYGFTSAFSNVVEFSY